MKIKNWIWVNKEGGLAGAGIGLLLYYSKFNLPFNLPFEGITKLIALIIIFGGIGALLDSVIEPNK